MEPIGARNHARLASRGAGAVWAGVKCGVPDAMWRPAKAYEKAERTLMG